MKEYFYKCHSCSKLYSSNYIENNLIYLCPSCESNEKNQPLNGVLEIVYDYTDIKKNISKDSFLKLQPGKLWEYPYLSPYLSSSPSNWRFLLLAARRCVSSLIDCLNS